MKMVVNDISKSIKGKRILSNISLEMQSGKVYMRAAAKAASTPA